jgi:hypothetical protein
MVLVNIGMKMVQFILEDINMGKEMGMESLWIKVMEIDIGGNIKMGIVMEGVN